MDDQAIMNKSEEIKEKLSQMNNKPPKKLIKAPKKQTFYLSDESVSMLNTIYQERKSVGKKANKSDIVSRAIEKFYLSIAEDKFYF